MSPHEIMIFFGFSFILFFVPPFLFAKQHFSYARGWKSNWILLLLLFFHNGSAGKEFLYSHISLSSISFLHMWQHEILLSRYCPYNIGAVEMLLKMNVITVRNMFFFYYLVLFFEVKHRKIVSYLKVQLGGSQNARQNPLNYVYSFIFFKVEN